MMKLMNMYSELTNRDIKNKTTQVKQLRTIKLSLKALAILYLKNNNLILETLMYQFASRMNYRRQSQ